jgi:hypothetical protein
MSVSLDIRKIYSRSPRRWRVGARQQSNIVTLKSGLRLPQTKGLRGRPVATVWAVSIAVGEGGRGPVERS